MVNIFKLSEDAFISLQIALKSSFLNFFMKQCPLVLQVRWLKECTQSIFLLTMESTLLLLLSKRVRQSNWPLTKRTQLHMIFTVLELRLMVQ